MFREIFSERQVNNIYLETPELSSYRGAINGAPKRSKTRVRWYGTLWQEKADATLELKSKNGMVGSKYIISLPQMSFGNGFSFEEYRMSITSSIEVNAIITNLQPILVNTYLRRYFSTPDGLCRVTIDRRQRFYSLPIATMGEEFYISDNRIVLELKFEKQDFYRVANSIQRLGWHISKNSKYVNGVNAVVFQQNTI
jgi:hypothetical protein